MIVSDPVCSRQSVTGFSTHENDQNHNKTATAQIKSIVSFLELRFNMSSVLYKQKTIFIIKNLS